MVLGARDHEDPSSQHPVDRGRFRGFDERWALNPFGRIAGILFGVSTFTPPEEPSDER